MNSNVQTDFFGTQMTENICWCNCTLEIIDW